MKIRGPDFILVHKKILKALLLCSLVWMPLLFLQAESFDNKIDSLRYQLHKESLTPGERIRILNDISLLFRSVDIDQSLEYASKSFKLAKQLDDEELYANTSLFYAETLTIKGEINTAISYFFESLTIWETLKNQEKIVACQHALGEAYRALADYDNSLMYLTKGYHLAWRINYIPEIKSILNRFSAVYYELKDAEMALAYADSSISVFSKHNTNELLSNSYNLIGAIYKHMKEYDSAIFYLRKALKVGFEGEGQYDIPVIYNNIVTIFKEEKEYDSAVFYARKSLNMAVQLGILSHQEVALLHLFESYKAMGKYDSALNYHEYYTGIRWQIYNQSRSKVVAEIQSKYETDKKEQENERLLLKNKLQEQKITKQKFIIALIILIVVLSTSIPILINKSRNALKRSNEILLQQKKEIENQTKQLSELNTTKDKILSIIAHDLKNPLHSIQGFSEIIADEAQKLNYWELSEYASMIDHGVENLNNLLDNLLNWSQLQIGNLQINKEITSVFEISTEIQQLFKTNILNKNLKFEIKLKPEHIVICDKLSISTVIRNLVSNAIKFTPENGTISISAKPDKGFLEICIEDSGVGMDHNQLEKLFQTNKEISRGTKNEKGSGLGMILCKEFVEINGGSIWVNSKINQGTRVCFTLSLP